MAGRTTGPAAAAVQFGIFLAFLHAASGAYLGKFIGKLSELHHGVSGEVYAVDARTLYLKDFTYDGQGPAAYFYAGNSRTPGSGGFRLRDENGSPEVIRRYRREGVTLTLPEGKTLNNIKWFSVWCEEFAVNFGDVKIPRNFDYPRPRKIDALRGVHGISSDNIVIVDAQTLLVPNLSYDGEAPDAKFWVGQGPKPSPQGVRVPDENGKEVPLRKYDRKTVVLTLPGDLTVFDIGHFGIWCEAFTVDFGHIQIPQNLNVPPSLKMLGVSPQSKLNCEVLHDDLAFEVRWAVAGDSIVLQLVAKLDDREYMSFGLSGDDTKTAMVGGDVIVAWIDRDTLKGYADDYYLDAKSQCSGPTGSCPDSRLSKKSNNIRLLNAAMVNGYSIVTYQRPLRASDQFDKQILTNESQPVIWAIGPLNQRNEVSFHSNWAKHDLFINFGRPPKWNCPMPETEQPPMKTVPVARAPQKTRYQEVTEIENDYDEPPTTTPPPPPTRSRNQQRRRGDSTRGGPRQQPSDGGRSSEKTTSRTRQPERRASNRGGDNKHQATRQVPTPAPTSKKNAWEIPAIQCYEPEDGVFYAQMGPTGGKRGYPAITGHVGWGISWYINGLLIPEINVVRGKTYTFVVEGGLDPEVPAKYHPFYITDDPVGGYEYKTPSERAKVKIFAGARQDPDGTVHPTGVGRLCHWTHTGDLEADDFESFGAYQRTLELKCDQGEPGVIQFTPDGDTPDTVYYQCFTHRYLGWKINVRDSCDVDSAASEQKLSVVHPKTGDQISDLNSEEDLEESPSIRVETRIKALNSIENTDKKIENVTEDSNNQDEYDQSQVLLPSDVSVVPNYFPQAIYVQNPMTTNFPSKYNSFLYPNLNLDNLQQTAFKPNPHIELLLEEVLNKPNEERNPTNLMFMQPENPDVTIASTESSKFDSDNRSAILTPPFTQIGNNRVIASRPLAGVPPLPHLRPADGFPVPPSFSRFHFKKPHRRPIMKHTMNRPYPHKFHDKPTFLSGMHSHVRPQLVTFMKKPAPFPFVKKFPSTTIVYPERPVLLNRPHPLVEISPLQASTEKEPKSTTEKPYAPLIYVAPSKVHYNNEEKATLKPAINTGFHPESVVVEGGFKPIVSKQAQDRIAVLEGPELEYESEIGVIDVSKEQPENSQSIQPFEPMFIPSPLDKSHKAQLKYWKKGPHAKGSGHNVMFIIKQSRTERRDVQEAEDDIAGAEDRIDSFYLPPASRKDKPPTHIMKPSNIDIPPGTVVSYDGKKVSGTSLTAKSAESAIANNRSSKVTQLIKAGPQFRPFKGDLPPLDPKFINKNAPQLRNEGLLNRDLESPTQGSTKLVLVRQVNGDADTHAPIAKERKKREAHHTPEHTAEQERLAKSTKDNSTSSTSSSRSVYYLREASLALAILLFSVTRYL